MLGTTDEARQLWQRPGGISNDETVERLERSRVPSWQRSLRSFVMNPLAPYRTAVATCHGVPHVVTRSCRSDPLPEIERLNTRAMRSSSSLLPGHARLNPRMVEHMRAEILDGSLDRSNKEARRSSDASFSSVSIVSVLQRLDPPSQVQATEIAHGATRHRRCSCRSQTPSPSRSEFPRGCSSSSCGLACRAPRDTPPRPQGQPAGTSQSSSWWPWCALGRRSGGPHPLGHRCAGVGRQRRPGAPAH